MNALTTASLYCTSFSLTYSHYYLIPFILLISTHPAGLSHLFCSWAGHCSELVHIFNLLNPCIGLIEKCQDYHYLHFTDKEKFSNMSKITQLLCSRTKIEISMVRSRPLFLPTDLQFPPSSPLLPTPAHIRLDVT